MATRLYTSLGLAALHYPPLLTENSWSRTEENEMRNKTMIHLNLANQTRRENPRGENLRRRHSRVTIAIHRRSEKKREARRSAE